MANLDDLSVAMLARLALFLCCLSAGACVWELLALQMPDSPLHLGVLSGPIAQLRNFAFGLGLGALGLAFLWRSLYAEGEGRLVLVAFICSALLHVGALLYAASQGMVAVQLLDPRWDARVLVYVRVLAHVLLTVSLVVLLVRLWRRSGR